MQYKKNSNMPKQPEIVVIDDDDDDDVIFTETAASTFTTSSTTGPVIKEEQLNPSLPVYGPVNMNNTANTTATDTAMSSFRIHKFNNPNANADMNTCAFAGNGNSPPRTAATITKEFSTNTNGSYNNGNTNNYCNHNIKINNNNHDHDNIDDDNMDDDNHDKQHEELPITHLPQPNYEKQFRAVIVKPLHNILESVKQDEMLSFVRMHLFVIMQGIYLEARRIYVDHNEFFMNDSEKKNANGVNACIGGGTSSSSNQNDSSNKDDNDNDDYNDNDDDDNNNNTTTSMNHDIKSFIGQTSQDFDKDYFLNAPGLYIHDEENVFFEHTMSECAFVDPDAEEITKRKLLPLVMKLLLKLGEGGGDRKSTFATDMHFLSVTAEDLIACMMLDFVGMVTKILSLVEIVEQKINRMNGVSDHNDHEDQDEDITSSRKRRRVENPNHTNDMNGIEQDQSQSHSPTTNYQAKPLPNILDYIGDEILSVFIKILGSDACCAGYNQSLLNMRREESNSQTSVEDAVYLYLPPFFKSHLFDTNNIPVESDDNEVQILEANGDRGNGINGNQDDDCIMRGNQLKDDFLSALRTGEWRNYYVLYHPTDASRELHQASYHSSSFNEARDAPPSPSGNLFMSRHLIAMARYFVQARGLVNLNKILLDCVDSCQNSIFREVDLDILDSIIATFYTISFISSYCIDNKTQNADCLKASSVMDSMGDFKDILRRFVAKSILQIHDFRQQEQRKLLMIIATLEERSLTSMEYTRLKESPTCMSSTFPQYFNFDSKEAHEMRLSALWKLLTGRNSGEDAENSPTTLAPTLQCQISALNEINSWVKYLENQVQSYRDQYLKMNNCSDDALYPPSNSENGVDDEINTHPQYDGALVVSDEMPCLIQSDNLNNDFLNEANKDNDSTEVCCYSNDSISSTNTDQDEKNTGNKDDNNTSFDSEMKTPTRGELYHDLLQEREVDFFDILELLKSKYNVMSHLFSPLGIHTELLKRSLPLLDVFSRNGKLKKEDLKMIWDITGFTARAKETDFHVHSSVTSAVFDLLLGLISKNNGWMALNGDMIYHYETFFSEVMNLGHWTYQSLNLVETIAHRSIDLTIYKVLAGQDVNIDASFMPAGLDVLWLLSQDICTESNDPKAVSNAEIALGALTRVVESIVTKCQQSEMQMELSVRENNATFLQREIQREKTMLVTMQSIQTQIIVRVIRTLKSLNHCTTNTTNIRILHHLILRLPMSSRAEFHYDKSNISPKQLILSIEDLVSYEDLLSVLVDEMVSYAVRVKDHVKKKQGNDLSNLYTHKDCVLYRHQLFQSYVSRCFELNTAFSDQSSQEPSGMPLGVARSLEKVDVVEEESDNQDQVKAVNSHDEKSRETQNSSLAQHSLFPTQGQLSKLWKYFVTDESLDVVNCAIEMLYNLLTSIVLKGSTQILDWRKQLVSILHPLCLELDSSTMSAATYRLLIYCIGHKNALCGNFYTVSYKEKCEDRVHDMSNILLGLTYNFEPATCSNSLHLIGQPVVEEVSNYNIIGLEKLWSIVLETNYDDVANMAMTYIAILYNFFNIHSSQSLTDMFTEQVTFAKHCITELNNGLKNKKSQTRLLYLMKLFVQHSSSIQEKKLSFSHGSSSEKINTFEVESVISITCPFSVFVQVVQGSKFTIYCPLGEKTKVSYLRESISRHLNQDFRLVFSGSELKENSVTLAGHQIKADALVFCCPRLSTKHVQKSDTVHVVEPLNEDNCSYEDEMHESTDQLSLEVSSSLHQVFEPKPFITPGIAELLGEDCLQKLFHFLSSPEDYRQDEDVCQLKALVWDLLQSLPTKPSVHEGINDIFSADQLQRIFLEQILPYPNVQRSNNISLFRLLYSLQVVERIFFHIKDSFSCSSAVKKTHLVHGKRKDFDGEEECVAVDGAEITKKHNPRKETLKSIVVIDEDADNEQVKEVIANDDNADDDIQMTEKDIEPRQVVGNFVKNGGLEHLLRLLLSFDTSCSLANANKIQCNHELSSLIVICANKLIYLLISITSLHDGYFQIILGSTDTCTVVFNQLLQMIHWAVAFQLRSTTTQSQSSKYITEGWSSSEISSALVLHCLKFMKLIATKISCTHMQLKMIIKREVITNAMKSSIVYSPSNIVRSSALPIFKKLLLLMDASGEQKRQKTDKLNDEDLYRIHLPSLSLLVSLLPVGREMSPSSSFNQIEISTRSTVLFDFLSSYISNAFSNLSTNSRGKVSKILVTRLLALGAEYFSREMLSEPQEINGVDELSKLVLWAILEIKVLTSINNNVFDTYLEGIVSILQSVVTILHNSELVIALASLNVSQDQTLLQLLFRSATFVQHKLKHRTKLHCTSPPLRNKLLEFLLILCKGTKKNEVLLLELLSTHLYSTAPRKDLARDWSIDPVLKQKGFTGHVGMKNQGATCYLNSLLQQFFHTIPFRCGLMSCEIGRLESASERSEEEQLLLELQRLFGNLLMSEKRDFDTLDLVKSIRGYDGNTIRPGEQQDVDEFFNLFCTRLETALKKLPQRRLLHDVFGGQISHLITCKTCQKSSERVEDCLSISLDVKGKHNIYESLQSYIRGEVLDGSNKYFCSHCKTKRDSIKRCCLKTLPNVLIFHLKRFDFDLEQLRKIKVNDRFEYPVQLNMKKMTKEGLKDSCSDAELYWRKDSYYQYTLRGVVVHTGTADSGHYYSLSNVREYESSLQDEEKTEGSWYCFNDSNVSPFDLATLENSTFGGVHDCKYRQMKKNDASKSYSAYLLIYDREDQYKFDDQMIANPKKVILTSNKTISNPWEEEIIEQNLRHAKDQVIFSTDYGHFITDLCNAAVEGRENDVTHSAIETMTSHFIDNIIHVRDRSDEIEKKFSLLTSWYEKSEKSCRWFLGVLSTSHRHWLEQIFFHCYKSEIRSSFVNLLEVIFQKLAPIERNIYYYGTEIEPMNNDAFDEDGDITVFTLNESGTKSHKETLKRIEYWNSKSVLAIFIGTLVNMLDDCEGYWRRFGQLFECLTKFADCGHEESVFLIRSGLILRLIDIYQRDKIEVSPSLIIRPPKRQTGSNDGQLETKGKMGEKDKRPNFLPLLTLFNVLIRSGNFRDESDDDISDSDSSVEEDKSKVTERCNDCGINVFVTSNYLQTLQISNLTFYLPKRDCYLATNREMVETMLNEFDKHSVHKDYEVNQKKLSATISQIMCQICFNNLENTLMVCVLAQRIIKDKKASESNVAVQVLSALVHMNDNHTHQRIKSITSVFFEGISSNTKYEKELLFILEALHRELSKRSPGGKGPKNEVYFHNILLDNIEILTDLFGRHITDTVKHRILCVIKSLLPTKRSNYDIDSKECTSIKTILRAYSGYELTENEVRARPSNADVNGEQMNFVEYEIIKDRIFAALKNLHMSVADAISLQSSQSRNDYFLTSGVLNNSQVIESATFFEYYATLRECLSGPKWQGRLDCDDDGWIYNVTEYLIQIFWDLDKNGREQRRCPADVLKGEIIRFFERLAQLDSRHFINAIMDKHQSSRVDSTRQYHSNSGKNDPVTKMLEVFITANNNFDYNNTYMVHFYGLLALLADNDKHFHDGVVTHDNWKWALKSFVLNKNIAQKGHLYSVILCNTLKYVQDDVKFRKSIYKLLSESFLQHDQADTAVLKLLSCVFDSEHFKKDKDGIGLECVTVFVSGHCGGMSKLSSWTKKIFVQISKDFSDDIDEIENLFEDLYHCINCMHIIIEALEDGELVKLMTDCWPEVDEINSIFTQIVTRTDDEWKDSYKESVEAKQFLGKTVLISTVLQRLLINASTRNDVDTL